MACHVPRSGLQRARRCSALAALFASLVFLAYRSLAFVALTQENRSRGRWVPKSSTAKHKPDMLVDAIADGRIFVSIAANADPELPLTMMSLLSAAERPELIHFGIVWQGPGSGFAAEDLSELAKLWNADEVNERFVTDMQLPHGSVPVWEMLDGRVRSIRMPPEDARGPCWARYLAQLLWEKEELQLQLDSHMRFVPGWDTKARAELKFCSETSEKAILCSYGAGYSLGTPYWETPKSSQASVNCANTFDSDGILLIKARELKAPLDEPRKHYFWGAQFSFSSADVLCEVPYDPQLQMLFFGEEILMAVRFFTHGWDVFTPREQLFHLWERDYRRVYWKDNRELFASLLKESQCRVLSQLETGSADAGREKWPLPGGGVSNPEKDHFSLGTRRTLEDYQVAAGVHFREKRLEARALRGGDNHHREDDFKEAMVLQKPSLKLSDVPLAELQGLAGASFLSDALVNDRSSYVAQTDTERFVLWYSTTNQTWLLNAGGVFHGLGQEARPVLYSASTEAEPTDVRQWYYFDAYMRRWLPSPGLHFQLKDEEVEEAESWWNALLKPVPLVELR